MPFRMLDGAHQVAAATLVDMGFFDPIAVVNCSNFS